MNEPRLYVQLADTPAKQARGLMFVKDMPQDEGMLFSFSRSRQLSFWGENTLIPLDIAFVNADGLIKNIDMISPLNKKPVTSNGHCLYAVEANAGFFEANNIKVGDKVKLFDESDDTCLVFQKEIKSAVVRGNQHIKTSQLMNTDYIADPKDQEQEEARSKYESLPLIGPEDIGNALVDQEFEEEPQQIVDQPSDMPEQIIPEQDLFPVDEQVGVPEFENVFDAIESFAKPTIDNGFMGNPMRIDYITKGGKQVAREVEPHGTFHADSTGNEILVTYDRTVGGIRAFIMKNIKAFALLDDKFEPKFRI